MIYIDLLNNPPPPDLIKEGQDLTNDLKKLSKKDRKKFIEDHSDYWGKLKKHYSELSNGKCWYTEAYDIASTYHMDHFRPKNETKPLVKDCDISTNCNDEPYWWLAFDWENYRYSCSVPNTAKNAYYPLRVGSNVAKKKDEICDEVPGIIDPTNEDDVIWITFGEDGLVYPACDNDNTWEADRVKLSVRVYNLNYPSLVDARVEIQNKCKRIVEEIIKIHETPDYNNNPLVRNSMKDKLKELREMINPKSELSSVAKSYILNREESFIKKIAC